MSPRAAARLESLGFTKVYDYEAGKSDWLAAALPSEGRLAGEPSAGDVVRGDSGSKEPYGRDVSIALPSKNNSHPI